MSRRIAPSIAAGLLVLGIASHAFALSDIPDPNNSVVEMAGYSGTAPLSVFNVPDGSGYAMTQARGLSTPVGLWEDATITLTLVSHTGLPVFAYPYEDLWLENTPSVPPDTQGDPAGLVACSLGAIADASTDIFGQTTFSGPFYAGGHVTFTNNGDDSDDDPTYVVVSGTRIPTPLPLLFNSADIDGDGAWTSAVDVILFSQRCSPDAEYSYSIDFFFDGVIDLSDLVLFTAARFSQCP